MTKPFQLTPPVTAEHDLQRQVFRALCGLLPPDSVHWSMDSANAPSAAAGAQRKARGCIAGVPDMVVLHAGRAIWLELKTHAKDSRLSPAQRELHERMSRAGHKVIIARDLAEVLDALEAEGVPLRGRVRA